MFIDGETRMRALLGNAALVRGGAITPLWHGDDLIFLAADGGAPEIRIVARSTGALRWTIPLATIDPDAKTAQLEAAPDGTILLTIGGASHRLSADGRVEPLTAAEATLAAARRPRITRPFYPTTQPPELEAISPDGRRIATLIDGDVWLRSPDGMQRRLTFDATADPRWSTAGAAWSPDGTWLALMRIDERAVDRIPLPDWTGDTARPRQWPYMRANGAIAVWRIHLIESGSGAIREIGGGGPDHFAFIQGFSADGRTLFYSALDRLARTVELFAYDIAAGEARRLLREESATFLYWPPHFIRGGAPVRWLADGRFLWLTEASGWNQLWLHARDGRPLRRLSEEGWAVTDIAAVDEAGGRVYFRGQPDPDHPYDIHLFRVPLAGGAPQPLSRAPGQHSLELAPDGGHYVDQHSSAERPPRAELRTADGEMVALLSQADTIALEALGWAPPERPALPAADGETILHGLLYKPADFDPAKSYPVIEQIYAGPQTIAVPHGFTVHPLAAFAQAGFVALIVDGRGTPGRGKAFQDVAVGRIGDYEIADHGAVLRGAAATRPWMDLSRVGIWGISYGGYFTIRAMLQAPDLYRAGVALAPAELGPGIMSLPIECYEGRPHQHPERYRRLANCDKLDRLAGDLLIISAADDVNTPLEQTMAYAEALTRLRKPFDQLVLPNCNHVFIEADGRSRLDFVYDRLIRHFITTLRPELPDTAAVR